MLQKLSVGILTRFDNTGDSLDRAMFDTTRKGNQEVNICESTTAHT
jgi:hypothetical protein